MKVMARNSQNEWTYANYAVTSSITQEEQWLFTDIGPRRIVRYCDTLDMAINELMAFRKDKAHTYRIKVL